MSNKTFDSFSALKKDALSNLALFFNAVVPSKFYLEDESAFISDETQQTVLLKTMSTTPIGVSTNKISYDETTGAVVTAIDFYVDVRITSRNGDPSSTLSLYNIALRGFRNTYWTYLTQNNIAVNTVGSVENILFSLDGVSTEQRATMDVVLTLRLETQEPIIQSPITEVNTTFNT